MSLTYYHNPRCSKSRLGLELLTSAQVKFEVLLYLEGALTQVDVEDAIRKYLKTDKSNQLKSLLRTQEDEYKALSETPPLSDISAWAQILAKWPKILERPLLVGSKACVLGRPPQDLLSSPDLL